MNVENPKFEVERQDNGDIHLVPQFFIADLTGDDAMKYGDIRSYFRTKRGAAVLERNRFKERFEPGEIVSLEITRKRLMEAI